MRTIISAVAAALVACACASTPATPEEAAALAERSAGCRSTDAPTGSHLVRKSDCAPVTK